MKKTVKLLGTCIIAGVLVVLMSSSAILKGWRAGDAEWMQVQIPENYSSKKAFEMALYVLSEKYEMGVVDKEEGYAYTAWSFDRTFIGTKDKNTRCRVSLKLSPDGRRLSVKTEVQILFKHHWRDGYIDAFSRQTCDDIQSSLR